MVTGGAGFVGSHCVLKLIEAGAQVVVLDNLRQGHRAAVPDGVTFIEADVGEAGRVLSKGRWAGVLHFASLSLVGESMREPMRYMTENAGQGYRLIEACVQNDIPKFVLSSTANLFGTPDQVPITETARIAPGSPYGESKLAIEKALQWAGEIHEIRFACLRYFNAAGADPDGRIGEHHDPETHLIPLAIDAALGRRPPLVVFGTDYPTPDGTAIRDYVHVDDLAEAHVLALEQLDRGSVIYNLGCGAGYSVKQVIASVERVLGRKVPHELGDRRAGDPAILIASSDRIQRETGWSPEFGDLDTIVRTAADWRIAHPDGYGSTPNSGTDK